jgi:hypothetical protein
VGAIVRIQTTTPEAAVALINVLYEGHNHGVEHVPLGGENTSMYEVYFQSADVEMGTGFVTLQRLLNEHTPGAGDGIVPVAFG